MIIGSTVFLGAALLVGVVLTFLFGAKAATNTRRLLRWVARIPGRLTQAYVFWQIQRQLIREAKARAAKAEAEAQNAEIIDFYDKGKRS